MDRKTYFGINRKLMDRKSIMIDCSWMDGWTDKPIDTLLDVIKDRFIDWRD